MLDADAVGFCYYREDCKDTSIHVLYIFFRPRAIGETMETILS